MNKRTWIGLKGDSSIKLRGKEIGSIGDLRVTSWDDKDEKIDRYLIHMNKISFYNPYYVLILCDCIYSIKFIEILDMIFSLIFLME